MFANSDVPVSMNSTGLAGLFAGRGRLLVVYNANGWPLIWGCGNCNLTFAIHLSRLALYSPTSLWETEIALR